MTKQQTIELLSQQLPGFYSVEQVIKLISDIEDSGTATKFELDSNQIKTLSDNIAESIESEGSSIIDDYELSMNYKEVELDSVEFNVSSLSSTIKSAIEDFMGELNEDDE
jgi:hypothetical protein